MEYLGAFAILAFIAFLAFRRKDLLTQKSDVDPKISKVFLLLIFLVPLLIVGLYMLKIENQGITPVNNNFNKKQEVIEPSTPKEQEYYDAPAGREEGFTL